MHHPHQAVIMRNEREDSAVRANGTAANANNNCGAGAGAPVGCQPPPIALGLDALHRICREVYPDQGNPLTVTAIVKYWLGGPDPLDYISMYDNPGCPELGVPPHWHYISFGLSDLHGDGRLHQRTGPGRPSGFGFELTFRVARAHGETIPPTWPASVMQQLAKYVFSSCNSLLPGDHVSWHRPLDGSADGKVTHILMTKDPQLPLMASTPHGDVSFAQIVGVTADELQAIQYWNGLGMINLLKSAPNVSPWLLTDMRRMRSVMEEDPTIAQKIQSGIEREGSNLSGVSAKCWWVQVNGVKSTERYREKREETDDDEENEERDVKPTIKTERLSPCESDVSMSEESTVKTFPGLHVTFNLESGTILPLALKGRVLHGRHFTFKSILSHMAITMVASSVTGTLVSREKPYAIQGPWLQVFLPDELALRMVEDLQVLNNPEQLQLPRTFSWPEHNLAITIIDD